MIGDRIDNDIEPANKLGMKTIWVKQGFSVYQIPMNDFQQADYVVDTVYIRTKASAGLIPVTGKDSMR
jgi:FMN phosphatase YigB (HAD superfamily)